MPVLLGKIQRVLVEFDATMTKNPGDNTENTTAAHIAMYRDIS